MKPLTVSRASFRGAVFTHLILALSMDPLLVWNYGTMAVLSGIGGLLFWLSFRRLDAEDAALDNIGESHYVES